jgi:hypothetical protein
VATTREPVGIGVPAEERSPGFFSRTGMPTTLATFVASHGLSHGLAHGLAHGCVRQALVVMSAGCNVVYSGAVYVWVGADLPVPDTVGSPD